jgi:GR25 family glycosyltransferase involved in LPS biosynthesis
MSTLLNHFERITIISLPERDDRRESLLKNLTTYGLAEPTDLTWLEAVEGRNVDLPSWWKSGPGAWGCRFSQLAAIESAQRDGLNNLLILEDDVVFHPRAGEWLDDIMGILPNGWGQLFLGGQHMLPPKATKHPKLLEGKCITRTHAYAVN